MPSPVILLYRYTAAAATRYAAYAIDAATLPLATLLPFFADVVGHSARDVDNRWR